uniref:Uncharacterized protein n=1 Tax=Lynx canadensis TaxID=61383 RepID=A0A667IWV8_LYNCA
SALRIQVSSITCPCPKAGSTHGCQKTLSGRWVSLGYWHDPYIQHLVRLSKERKAPEINRSKICCSRPRRQSAYKGISTEDRMSLSDSKSWGWDDPNPSGDSSLEICKAG